MMDKVIAWLGGIGKDKYQHFAVGAIIALGVFAVATFVFGLFLGNVATFWVAFDLSMIAVTAIAIWKEYKHDAQANWYDILFTMLGGAIVWASAIITYF